MVNIYVMFNVNIYESPKEKESKALSKQFYKIRMSYTNQKIFSEKI
jgi:hypothetical protein